MKKLLLLLSTILFFTTSEAQDYLGLSTGNYSGIHGIMLQPANVADNRYKFEVNLVSTNIGFQNNYLGFSREFFIKNRFSFKDYDTYADFQQNVLTEQSINGNSARFNLSNRLNLPSVLVTTGKKSGIAIGIQSRTGVAIDNMNVGFAGQLYNNFQDASSYNTLYSLDGLNMNAMNWVEGSFTYGRVLLDNGKHFLKAGVTAKYLGGVSSWYLQANDLDITVNNDSTLRASGSDVRYGHSESNFSGTQIKDFEPDASGFGFDAGLVYEFRGRINKFNFLKLDKKKQEVNVSTRRDKNKYSFKVGVSILDAGKLTFNSTPLARDFQTNASSSINGIHIKNTGIKNVQSLDTFISQHVNYTGAIGQEFSVAMPTALSAQVDLHLLKGFYVNAMAYMPIDAFNKNTDSRVFTPNYYAVTPRWESRVAGLYVPLVLNNNYNDARELSAGATLRIGPAFVGTSNLLTLVRKDEIQSANVHFGLKIPVAHGKPSKAAKWFKKFTNEKEDGTETETIEKETIIEKEKLIEKKEVTPTPAPIQIIINNYNGTAGTDIKSKRIIEVDPTTGKKTENTIIIDDNTSKEQYENRNLEVEEMKSMQEQIEYLKFKLKQKEILLDEIQNEQEMIHQGNSTNQSKKKIDSLTNNYLYNNNFEYIGDALTVDSANFNVQAKMFELRKELLNLDTKNVKLDREVAQLSRVNDDLVKKMNENDVERKQSMEALHLIITDLRTKEAEALKQPAKAIYHYSPEPNYEQQKMTSATSPKRTPISADRQYSDPRDNNQPTEIQYIDKRSTTSSQVSQEDYESLKAEIRALRSELKDAKKTNKPNRKWVVYNGTNKQTSKKSKSKINRDSLEVEKFAGGVVIRDTVYIEKPVEKIVTKIVRDTITNTIEKNNTITKTETKFKEVAVDNTKERLLEMPAYFVLFDVASANIKQIFRNKLNYYAMQLKKYPSLHIKLTGHADASGNAQANLALSKRRAQQVRNYLILKGVARHRISSDFNGDQDPLADNKTKTGKSQNRRVEVLFVK